MKMHLENGTESNLRCINNKSKILYFICANMNKKTAESVEI